MNNEQAPASSASAPEPRSRITTMLKKFNKKVAIFVTDVVVIGAFAYMYKGYFVAAMVNGQPISRFAVIQELEKESGKKVLDAMITQKLINGAAQKSGVSVTPDEVDAQIKTIESSLQAQGGTLDAALQGQGMTREDLTKQLTLKLTVEKVLADKIQVSDDEVAKYILDNKIEVPKGQEAMAQTQLKDQLKNQKFNQAAGEWVASLKTQAKISNFVNY